MHNNNKKKPYAFPWRKVLTETSPFLRETDDVQHAEKKEGGDPDRGLGQHTSGKNLQRFCFFSS